MFTVLMTKKSYCPLWKGFMIIYSLFAAVCKVLWHKNGLSHPSVGSSFLWLSLRWLTNNNNKKELSWRKYCKFRPFFQNVLCWWQNPLFGIVCIQQHFKYTKEEKKTRIILIQFDRPFIQFKVFSPKSLFCKPSTMKLKLKVDF